MLYQLVTAALAVVSTSGFFMPNMNINNHAEGLAQVKMPFNDKLVARMHNRKPQQVGKSITVSWSDCTSSNAEGSVSNVVFIPNPPVVGGNNTILGMGAVKETVTDGTWELKVYDGALKILDDTGDICKSKSESLPLNAGELYYEAVDCPVSVGNVNTTLVAYISDSAPSGTIKTDLTAKDTSGNELFCVEVTMVIS